MSSIDRFRAREGAPLIYGHRGASAHATENTTAAIERARADGADGAEIDVQLAACGEVIVFHDDSLVRLASRSIRVAETAYAELATIELEAGRSGGRVPTLGAVLECAGDDLLLNVEIKTPGPRRAGPLVTATLDVLRRHRATKRVLISSFDPTILLRLRRVDPRLHLGLLFHRNQSLPLRRAWLAPLVGAMALHPDEGLVWGSRVDSWRRSSLIINVWTVDDARRARQLARDGVDGIITNDPAALRSALSSFDTAPR